MPMRINTPMPAFDGATEWVNGDINEVLAGPPAKLTLVHFWSLSCGICKENLPRVSEWRETHKESGLRVVQALQTGGLCQAEWRPGQKTLNG